MTASEPSPNPASWRDVYALVRDTHDDVIAAVGKVECKFYGLYARFSSHLVDHSTSQGEQRGESRIFGIARSTLTLIASLIASCAAGIAILRG